MSGSRQPIELIKAKGRKHLTKSEIEERERSEIKPIANDIAPPSYLTSAQKKHFTIIADQLIALNIMGNTDIDAVARYVVANDLYITAIKNMRKKEVRSDPNQFLAWSKVQERYFKQCRSAATDLGLTISSRCKLVIPEPPVVETAPDNKFARFER